ncbi:MFS transporter [Allonocardiopsis opalescens]|uniref:Fucose permease n=1 Tax=Allonocardiopsis opalescens TaxID=1144618 RepID=A0A2T0Q4S6_9ACTN|nr:MFS transporter [Allonocardiopsis opalescens]PRX98806.1 fucose permease [Allonocardiopsis opalescens]
MSADRRARRSRAAAPPAPLGPRFARLWWASAVTNLGDGALLAAGPLLVASLDPRPAAVAGGALAQQLPWLLFALASGALVDRLPRRALLVAANLARAGVLALLAAAVLSGTAGLWTVYLALFLLGTGETLADTAYGTLVAAVVPPDRLGRANARLALTHSLNNQLLGPPLGALLFAAGLALPFGFHALAFALSALLVARVGAVPTPRPEHATARSLTAEVAEGLAWLWRDTGLRTLAGCILVMNLAGVGTFALWVLYARERLGLSDAGFGLFIAAGAVGGVAGSWVYERLEPRVGRVALLRGGLVVEALTYAALALITHPLAAGAVMALFGVHAVVWGTAAVTVRQQVTPAHLLGRVTGAYRLADLGGAALGALLGGAVATAFGLLAPFWLAFAAVGLLAAVAWRGLGRVAAAPGEAPRPS